MRVQYNEEGLPLKQKVESVCLNPALAAKQTSSKSSTLAHNQANHAARKLLGETEISSRLLSQTKKHQNVLSASKQQQQQQQQKPRSDLLPPFAFFGTPKRLKTSPANQPARRFREIAFALSQGSVYHSSPAGPTRYRTICLRLRLPFPQPHPPPCLLPPSLRPLPLIEAAIHMQVRLTSGSQWDAENPSCDSPNASRRFALGPSNLCLVGEHPTCSVPAL